MKRVVVALALLSCFTAQAEEARINRGQSAVELVCTKALDVYAVRIDPVKRTVEINGIQKTVVELQMRPNLIIITFDPSDGFFNINRVSGYAYWSRNIVTTKLESLELHCEAGAKPKF